MIKIVADSGCDLTALSNPAPNVVYSRVPLKVIVGETEFVDTPDLDVRQMMDAMYAYRGKTSSACPSPEEWADLFRDADQVYVMPISKGVSGSYNSAMVAKNLVLEACPNKQIHIFDSLTAGAEMSMLVEEINRLIASGLSFEAVCAETERYQNRTHLFFLLNSVENFVKNGRIGKVAGMTVKLLNIKILGTPSEEGELTLLHKCRGMERAKETIIKEMKARGFSGGRVIIGHTFQEKGAAEMRDLISGEFPGTRFTIMPMSGLCSYYAEDGGILIGFEG